METTVTVETSGGDNPTNDTDGGEGEVQISSPEVAAVAAADAAVALARETAAEAELAAAASVRQFSETVEQTIGEFATWQGLCDQRVTAIEAQLASLAEGVSQALSILPSLIREEVQEEVTETLQSAETNSEDGTLAVETPEPSQSNEGEESQEARTERRHKFRWT